jgi:hypothetical protein
LVFGRAIRDGAAGAASLTTGNFSSFIDGGPPLAIEFTAGKKGAYRDDTPNYYFFSHISIPQVS